jgi:hypothetical protein
MGRVCALNSTGNHTSLLTELHIMKTSHILTCALAFATTASAQVLASDDFSYSGALTSNGWSAHSGAGSKVINANGFFATLDYSAGSGEDINIPFTAPQLATDITYASFILNVPSGNPVNPDGSGSYFAHLKDAAFAFKARTGLLSPAGSGDYALAINADNANLGAGAVWPSDLSFDTDYKVVISWDAATGESKMWVDPTSSASASVSHTGTTTGSIMEQFALRQSNDHTGFINVDDVVAGKTFDDVAGAQPTQSVPASGTLTSGLLGLLLAGAGAFFARRRLA